MGRFRDAAAEAASEARRAARRERGAMRRRRPDDCAEADASILAIMARQGGYLAAFGEAAGYGLAGLRRAHALRRLAARGLARGLEARCSREAGHLALFSDPERNGGRLRQRRCLVVRARLTAAGWRAAGCRIPAPTGKPETDASQWVPTQSRDFSWHLA